MTAHKRRSPCVGSGGLLALVAVVSAVGYGPVTDSLAAPATGAAVLGTQSSMSSAQLWTALGGKVTCGVAIHPVNSPPMQLLCNAKPVPPPKAKGIGDPGFVFLGSTGRPSLA